MRSLEAAPHLATCLLQSPSHLPRRRGEGGEDSEESTVQGTVSSCSFSLSHLWEIRAAGGSKRRETCASTRKKQDWSPQAQRKASFSTRRGGQRPRRQNRARAAEGRGGASRVPPAPLEGPLPAPEGGPSLQPRGGADFSTGGRDSAQPGCGPEPLKRREGQGRQGPGWRGGEG